ncbi:MAG: CDP-glycerol glycerophosphotransferase family protein [Bacteroidales bacterium]|nr:CDP-glycerol glycerophosphotransferase family protein [Bacteroidales bacterium]
MKAIVINRKLSKKESDQVQKMIHETEAKLYASVSIAGENLKKFVSLPEISEDKKKAINYRILDFVVSFGNRLLDGRSVADRLKFDQSSIWYYHKFRAYFRLRNIMYEIVAIKELADVHNEIYYYTNEPLLSKAALPQNVRLILNKKRNRKASQVLSILNYLIILFSRWVINIFLSGKPKKHSHIIMDVSKRQSFLDIRTLKEKKGNYILGYLLDQADDFLIIDEAVQPKISGNAKIRLTIDNLFGKGGLRNRYFGEPVLLGYFFSKSLKKKRKALQKDISQELKTIFNYCQSSEEKILVCIYQSLMGSTKFYLIKYLAYTRFFKKNTVRSISSTDENSPALRCILDAARINGITTIALQHGNIHDLHPAYIYTPEDAKRQAFPDISLVWGDHWKQFLENKGNYPENALHVCGQIRTDIIPMLLRSKPAKQNVIPGLRNNETLIVYASQPQRDPQLRERAALDVMKAVKQQKNSFLLIKLHPNEKDDTAYYAGMAQSIGLERIKITLATDLYLIISVCDILITCFSTVGTETVYFKKPLIVLDHLRQDIQNYIKEGVGFQATNAEEIKENIEGILNGNLKIDEAAYDNYISKFAYAIDGKAVQRVLQFIRSV